MAHWAVATRPTILQVWPVPARRSLKSYRPPSVKSGSPATSQAGGPLEIGEAGCVIVLEVDLVIPDQMLGDIEPLEGAPPPGNHFAPAESGRLAARSDVLSMATVSPNKSPNPSHSRSTPKRARYSVHRWLIRVATPRWK